MKDASAHSNKEDIFGNTPLSNARKLRSQEIIDIIVESDGIHARDFCNEINNSEEDSFDHSMKVYF